MELTHEGSWLALRLKDNGRGFSRTSGGHAGNGLRNMRRRMDDLAATFTLESAPGDGTCITLRVPLPHSQIR